MWRVVLRVALSISALWLAGCAQNPADLPLSDEQSLAPPSLQYLGVGGYLLRWQGEAIAMAPSFSNPATLGQPPLLVEADTAKIDALMPKADDVSMLLVGHAHYDHLLDVPYVLNQHTPKAKVYGSKTVGHILAAAVARERIVDVQSHMADGRQAGQWFYSPQKRVRIMALKSEHAPHFMGIKFLQGSVDEDLTELPKTVWGWPEGQTVAFLIDLLDATGEVRYRIHYQDAASTPPLGLPPQLLGDVKPVDVAILCVGAWDQVPAYPQVLLKRLKPRMAVLGHWEDFFGNDPRHPQGLRLQDIQGMVRVTRENLPAGATLKLPVPFAQLALPAPQRHE
ncbi:MBL fold metallo-hydrolase [Atopomonas sediminilitoris]|uniref:MBL fold metallo-hydrolase n=1 Tax=Atopomonas sediminilitoris TaxID=2919919 RepID=UPI001F4DFE9C|nr:MBL fold metallo-hydrolase [Atopomonas sediminilitoris]MCJ8169940.1 MBL fold metallo-hydrolase [Atopomonas sediminilitoris]